MELSQEELEPVTKLDYLELFKNRSKLLDAVFIKFKKSQNNILRVMRETNRNKMILSSKILKEIESPSGFLYNDPLGGLIKNYIDTDSTYQRESRFEVKELIELLFDFIESLSVSQKKEEEPEWK